MTQEVSDFSPEQKKGFKQEAIKFIDNIEASIFSGLASGDRSDWIDAFSNSSNSIVLYAEQAGCSKDLMESLTSGASNVKKRILERGGGDPRVSEKIELLFRLEDIRKFLEKNETN